MRADGENTQETRCSQTSLRKEAVLCSPITTTAQGCVELGVEGRQSQGGPAVEARTERYSWTNNTQEKQDIWNMTEWNLVTPESMTLSLLVHHQSNSSPGAETNTPATKSPLSRTRVCYVQSQQCARPRSLCWIAMCLYFLQVSPTRLQALMFYTASGFISVPIPPGCGYRSIQVTMPSLVMFVCLFFKRSYCADLTGPGLTMPVSASQVLM